MSMRDIVVTIKSVVGRVKTELFDSKNNPIGVAGNPLVVTGSGGGGSSNVNVHSGSGTSISSTGTALDVHYTNTTEATASKQDTQTALLEASNSLVLGKYDNITVTYTGANPTTIVYKLGATVVSTLTCTYDVNDNILTVVKS